MKILLSFLTLLISLSVIGQSAEKYFQDGKSKYELKEYKAAIIDCIKAIEADAPYKYTYNTKGRTLIIRE